MRSDMNLNDEQELDREVELPYEIHQYKLVDKRYMSFIAPPTKKFKIVSEVPVENDNGEWRYKAQWINGWVWVSVEVGVYGSKKMWKHFTDRVELLKRVEAAHIKYEEDWDKIYQVARKVLGV